jgi:Patatin-like phospholipase
VQYSPSRRTALVLCGTGAHGAYHAGVLRAFQEAGVRIDLVAGHGVGAAGAVLSAIDGSGRLWEPAGIWRSRESQTLYAWTPAVRVALWALLALLVSLLIPTLLMVLTPSIGSIRQVAQVVIAVVLVATASIAVALGVARSQWQGRRRAVGTPWSGIAGAPFEATRAIGVFSQTIWQLIRGASRDPQPPPDSGRRYADVLAAQRPSIWRAPAASTRWISWPLP